MRSFVVTCTNCGEPVEVNLLDGKDIRERYKLGPNSADRTSDSFPEPVLGGPKPQKFWYLEEHLEDWRKNGHVREFRAKVDGFSKDELRDAIAFLEEKLQG